MNNDEILYASAVPDFACSYFGMFFSISFVYNIYERYSLTVVIRRSILNFT